MTIEKERETICKLSLDVGIRVENVDELSRREEDVWTRIYQHFGYTSPLNLLVKIGKDTYACRSYRRDPEDCKRCPAYQP